jgi:hypothetical protein
MGVDPRVDLGVVITTFGPRGTWNLPDLVGCMQPTYRLSHRVRQLFMSPVFEYFPRHDWKQVWRRLLHCRTVAAETELTASPAEMRIVKKANDFDIMHSFITNRARKTYRT